MRGLHSRWPWRPGIVMHRIVMLGIVMWGIAASSAQAQPGLPAQPVSDTLVVSARGDRERMTVGDPLTYTVAVLSPPGASVTWPDAPRTLGPFEVLSFTHDGPFAGDAGRYADTLRYVLTAYTVGDRTIPAILFPYTLRDGTKRTGQADSVRVTVVSVITDEAKDIRDLKQPAAIPTVIPWYIWAGGGALLLGLILGGIYLYRRHRRRAEQEEEAPALPRSPYEIARDELEQLARFHWIEQGKIAEHYTALSEIIRRYVSARYRVAAMEITTNELVHHLGRRTRNLEHIRMIDAFLQECDLVKFAKFIPPEDQMDASIDEARVIVERTKEVEAPLPASTAPAHNTSTAPA